jgi:hypothetical protein
LRHFHPGTLIALLFDWLNQLPSEASMRGAALSFSFLLSASLAGCWLDTSVDGRGRSGWYPPAPSSSGSHGVASANVPTECIDPSGFGGRGCFKCTPQTNDELANACTTSRFEAFENEKRIAGFTAANPKPAAPTDLGPTPAPYEGGTTTTDPTSPAPACPITTKPNPVMVLGATGFPLETVAKAMGTTATIFYAERPSCDGIASMVLDEPKVSGEIVYFDADGTRNRCTLTEARSAEIALSALFPSTCGNQSNLAEPVFLPADVDQYTGPANPIVFATAATSTERAISAEAAYRVYGFGDRSGVAPWTDEDLVFRRNASSGNQQTTALSLGLDPKSLRGRDSNGSSNMLAAIRESPSPNGTIGISSAEIVDPNRDVLRTLAYRHYDQEVAFYPDSEAGSFDRKNVRDGHYYLWSPLHVFARSSAPERVRNLVLVLASRKLAPVPSVDLFGALKRIGNVPQCAMHVTRAQAGAELSPYTPPVTCDCAFDAASPGITRADCMSCKSASDCPTSKPTCSFGYCEP